MDYTGLEIRGRQIRLVSIRPVPAGRDEDTWPVECTMTVRRHPLPTGPAGSNDADSSRSTHISFDHCVTEPPTESFVEELRQQLAPALWAAERRRGWASRVAGRIRKHVFGRRRERVLTISTDDITRLLSREAMVKIMADPARSGERRIWAPSVDIHRFEDAVGHTLLISDRKPQPHTGFLRPGDLNPFFRSWDPPHPTLLLDRLGEALHPTTYVALSYAWGPPEPTAEITVNGKTVAVRANLEAALRRFRKLEYFRFGGRIWIDSLCINQADEAEKQRQVAMMASVYSNAGNVVVWLGPEANDSDLVISYLEHVGTDYRAEYLEALDKSDPLTAATWRAVARARMEASYDSFRDCHLRRLRGRWWCAPVPVDLDDIALPLYRFFDRPYWRRLWIIQELCMGRPEMPVVCGGRVTQWRHIRDGVLRCLAILDILGEAMREALADRRQQPPPPAGGDAPAEREHSLFHVAQIAQLEIAGHRRALPRVPNEALPVIAPTVHEHGPLLGSALRRAVILASQSECSVPHDRIYGMLSIPGLPGLGVDIDYSKSVADVFTEFTAACVRHKSLDFLALLDGGPIVLTDERGNLRRETEKPTWVPDYGAKPERRIGIIDGDWNAGGYVPTSWCGARVVGQCLVLHGKVVDQVDGVGAISKADLESGATTFPGGNPLPGLSQPSNEANTKEREGGEDVLYRVLVGGCDVSGSKQIEAFESLYTAFPGMPHATQGAQPRGISFCASSHAETCNLTISSRRTPKDVVPLPKLALPQLKRRLSDPRPAPRLLLYPLATPDRIDWRR